MQHKSNTTQTKSNSHLSTTIDENFLVSLRRKLPTDWVERVQGIVTYSSSRIREVLRDQNKYNDQIMDAIITVAEKYQVEVANGVAAEVASQKSRIQNLINS